jgi:hypothetical protein
MIYQSQRGPTLSVHAVCGPATAELCGGRAPRVPFVHHQLILENYRRLDVVLRIDNPVLAKLRIHVRIVHNRSRLTGVACSAAGRARTR